MSHKKLIYVYFCILGKISSFKLLIIILQMRNFHLRNAVIILFALLLIVTQSQVLAKLNFSSIISLGSIINYSGIGITFDFITLIPYLNSTLLRGYLKNSQVYGSSDYLFIQNIHMPLGYKYGCASTLFGGLAVNCTLDISLNSTLINNMNVFFQTAQYMGTSLGWDIQKVNFTRNAYKNNFASYFQGFWGNSVNVELLDKGDTQTTYTPTTLVTDIPKVYPLTYGYILAPGLTQNNTLDLWWGSVVTTLSRYLGIFTLRCVIFKNISDATISNLMNDTYVDGYIKKRLTQPNGTYNDPSAYTYAFSDIRLTDTVGINGVTNSFAAAIWALDFSLKFMSIKGHFSSFYSSFAATSNQSVLGPAPNFGPQGIYYGLLFANYAISKFARFITTNVTAGTSPYIKVYTFKVDGGYRAVLINKDMNTSSNGTVDISLNSNTDLDCTYMQADSLNSTTGITIGNVSFVSNSSDFVGLYRTYQFSPDDNAVYHIPLRYAQAVVCTTIPKTSYAYFPRKSTLTSYELLLQVIVSLYLIVILL